MDISTIKFDYIKSNQYKSEYDADENNGKKGYEVLSGGFIFAKKKAKQRLELLAIKHKKCKASITIGFDDKVINISSNQHNIIQPSSEIPEADWHVPLQENQIKTLSFLKKVKERVSNGEECDTAKIWEDEQNKLFKTLMTDQDKDEVASLIPAFSSLKHGLQKRKSKNRPKLPTSLSSIVIDETSAFVKYKHALQDVRPPPRKKLSIGRDNEIIIFKKLLLESSIDIDVYVKQLVPLFSFRKNKNKDKSPDDSDSSDDEETNVLLDTDSDSEDEYEEHTL
ncbi:unnamed protein product [Brachionus calyciflorus]|uniref:Uncharacterized protein n=1 Tax=Brachionus calyciflorus TaxID=104777 RepID=A0A813TIH4_9BILA|nr:unnamed protein product [Brachionus calyciflorus]